MPDDSGDFIWVEYDGVIGRESERAIGLKTPRAQSIELWLPKASVQKITYVAGGDSAAVHLGRAITALRIPRWLAKKSGLAAGGK